MNEPQPKGGLTWEREKAVVVAAAAPVALLVAVLTILFPDLLLSAPFGAAILAQIMLGVLFRGLYRPVGQPRLIRFIAATIMATSAAIVAAAMAIHAMGWSDNSLPAILAGFGGTMFALYHIHKWLFMALIERHDRSPEGEAAQ